MYLKSYDIGSNDYSNALEKVSNNMDECCSDVDVRVILHSDVGIRFTGATNRFHFWCDACHGLSACHSWSMLITSVIRVTMVMMGMLMQYQYHAMEKICYYKSIMWVEIFEDSKIFMDFVANIVH